jgi:recombination protein RecT
MSEATALQKKSTLPPAVLESLQALTPRFPDLLPQDITTEQFRAALWLELTGRPTLSECTPASLRECAVKAATYGLLPGRDVHFLPFRTRGRLTATYVPNYQGIILALERSGKVRRAFAHPVHEGDEWGFDLFADRPVHKPAVTLGKAQGKELFYYGAIMFKDGTCAFEVVTLDDLENLKRRAPSHEDGPWVTDRVMMNRKSAIKRVAKYVRLTPELQGLLADEEVRELTDIAPARTRATVSDLFGDDDDRRNPTTPEALKQTRGHESHPPQGEEPPRVPLDPIWQDMERLYAQAGRAAHYHEFCVWACKRYRVARIEEIVGQDLLDVTERVYATLEPLITARKQAEAQEVNDQGVIEDVSAWDIPNEDPPIGDGETGPSWGPESPDLAKEEEDAALRSDD